MTAWAATRSWLFAAAPLDRLAVFRLLVYLFIPLDVLVTRTMGTITRTRIRRSTSRSS